MSAVRPSGSRSFKRLRNLSISAATSLRALSRFLFFEDASTKAAITFPSASWSLRLSASSPPDVERAAAEGGGSTHVATRERPRAAVVVRFMAFLVWAREGVARGGVKARRGGPIRTRGTRRSGGRRRPGATGRERGRG